MAAASHWVNGLTIIDCTPCKRPQPFKTFVIMTTEEMQKQIESMMPTQQQIVESIDKKLDEKREQIVHNILSEYAKDNGLVKYEYSDGFYCFGNPDCQELADKKHEEWLEKQKLL